MIGVAWHAWSDRYDAADDAHQINMGLFQCDDPPRGFVAGARWTEAVDRVRDINCNIESHIERITGL